jgi:hypothetical protein
MMNGEAAFGPQDEDEWRAAQEAGDYRPDDEPAVWDDEPEYGHCLECADPPMLDEIEFGQLVCPQCGQDWISRDQYDEGRAEVRWDGRERRYVAVFEVAQ